LYRRAPTKELVIHQASTTGQTYHWRATRH